MQIILDSRYLLVDPYYSETWNFIVDPHIPFMTNWSIVTQAEYTEGWLRHNFMMTHMRMRMGRVVILKMSLLINEIGLGLIYCILVSIRNEILHLFGPHHEPLDRLSSIAMPLADISVRERGTAYGGEEDILYVNRLQEVLLYYCCFYCVRHDKRLFNQKLLKKKTWK